MKKIKFFLILALLSGSLAVNAKVVWVTSASPTGAGSLATVIAAATTVNGDTVKFDTSTWGDNRTITVSTSIAITKDLVIDGEDNNIILSGNKTTGIMSSSTVNRTIFISNLTFKEGNRASGGAITFTASTSNYTLTNVNFLNNESSSAGGAISSTGTLTVNNCYFSGNKCTNATYGGGAIRTSAGSILIVSNSIFENNLATNGSGGAILGMNITVKGSVFKDNTAQIGGAIVLNTANNIVPEGKILANTFIGNSSTDATGGGSVLGAGTYVSSGSTLLAANIFQDNTSADDAAHNEFFHTNATFSITSAGYNVFKGAAVPAAGANTWTGAATDIASVADIVNAESYRLLNGSAAYEIIDTETALIDGLSFPETDIFDNEYTAPYNAGADQTKAGIKDIVAVQPDIYQNGVEKNIGVTLAGSPLSFEDVGFLLPEGLTFTDGSYTLKDSTVFTLSDISIEPVGNGAYIRLQLTVDFTPAAEQEYIDTLVVSAEGANDFVLPLRGVGIAYTVSPLALQNFGNIVAGQRSGAKTVTITGSSVPGDFSYTWENGQSAVFPVLESAGYSASAGGDLSIRFAPQTVDEVYTDTLVISRANSDLIYKVPLEGAALPVGVAGNSLFGEVVLSSSRTQTLTVTVAPGHDISITSITSSSPQFTFEKAENWSDTEGGDLLVTFAPLEAREYIVNLTLSGAGFANINIRLEGAGLPRPVVGSDAASLDFGRVVQGETATGDKITLTLTNPQSLLTEDGVFTLALDAEFSVVSVTAKDGAEPPAAEVILSFTPSAAREYLDTLIVRAAYAEEYRIPLSGEGFTPVVTSDPAALDFGEVVVGETAEETVTVTLSDPASPLSADDFSLAAGSFGLSVGTVASSETADAVEVTLTFAPILVAEYLDTLIVRAAYAAEYRIPLSGTGKDDAVAIRAAKASTTPSLSVRNGDIVVSGVSAGSRISIYNLHGRPVKTQTAVSGVETLKTASFPRSVYIVVLRDDKQEILRRKVVL